jgi:hypothetical protein
MLIAACPFLFRDHPQFVRRDCQHVYRQCPSFGDEHATDKLLREVLKVPYKDLMAIILTLA